MPEKIEFSETPTSADIETFHDDTQREADLQEAMMGDRHQDGGQHDLEQRGFTSVSQDEQEQQLREMSQFQEAQYPQPQSAKFVQDQPQESQVELPPSNGEQNYQQLYGQSENEKGELRRALKQQMEANQQLLQQVQMVSQQPPVMYQQPPVQPMYPPQGGVQMAQPQVPQHRPLLQKEAGEMVVTEDLDEAFRTGVEPHLAELHQRMQQMQAVIQQQQMAFLDQQKVQSGITPQIESQLISENPWLRQIPTPQGYLQALQGLVQQKQSQALLQRTSPAHVPGLAQQPVVNPAVQGAARRATFIERGVPRVAETGGVTAQQRFNQEWQKTLLLPVEGGQRSAAQRALLKMAGTQQVSGFRDPTVSTR